MSEAPSAAVSEADRVNQRFAGVGAALGLVAWFYLFSFPLGQASAIALRTRPRLGLFLGFLAMVSVVPGVLWRAKAVWGEQWRKALPLAPVGAGLLFWTVLCVLALQSVVIALLLALGRTVGLPGLPDPLASVGVLGVLLGAPLAEEVLFRGYGLARIRELAGERRALLLTALVFAVLHGSWVKLPGTFATGLFLGWLVLQTGSLWPALLGHVANNGLAFLLIRWGSAASAGPGPMPWPVILVGGAAGLAVLALLGSRPVRDRIRELRGGLA
jgi:membrane protease YdiL (CAAX protease family)